MLPNDVSNRAYDTSPYEATILIYGFDLFDKPRQVHPMLHLKNVSMDTAKRRATAKAKSLGLTARQRHWVNLRENFSKREYQTENGARRLIVVERS